MKQVIHVNYSVGYSWDTYELGIRRNDIEEHYIKWGLLFVKYKGEETFTEYEPTMSLDECKWPDDVEEWDDDHPDPFDVPLTEEEQVRADYENAMLIQSKRDRREWEASHEKQT
jgi:hypothetical protein